MAQAIRVSGTVSGTDKVLAFETGKLAQQSQGAVVASLGETTVLTTANAAKSVRDGIDFFPLTVDVEERTYAAGRIPGSFFRREGRPSEDAILTCRLTDRPLRPSFPDGYRNETQIVTTVLGADQANPHDVLSINAASAALMVSGIPFDGPIGAVRIAYGQDGTWIPHPTYTEGDESTFELVVAGRELDNGDVAIMMVEAGGTERSFAFYESGAPKVDETVLADGLEACLACAAELEAGPARQRDAGARFHDGDLLGGGAPAPDLAVPGDEQPQLLDTAVNHGPRARPRRQPEARHGAAGEPEQWQDLGAVGSGFRPGISQVQCREARPVPGHAHGQRPAARRRFFMAAFPARGGR
jgi:ribonuclease PH